jgi:hypothetical protein
MSDNARRPVLSHPDFAYEYDEDGEKSGVSAGWDLAFGCRVNFNLDDGEPYVSVSFSDYERRNGGCNRSVTREQIRGFAYYLIQMTEEMDGFLPSTEGGAQ